MKTFRFILDAARDAALNMAIDEILAERQKLATERPTLRFYGWDAPAVSVGYFQDVSSVARKFSFGRKPATLVRRLTGGGLVFHGEDLTFSLCLPSPSPHLPSTVKESYLRVSEAVRAGLSRLFPGLDYADCKTVPSGRARYERACFEAPSCYDLLLGGKKVLGASQRRSAGTLLHQSSLFLERDRETLTRHILMGFELEWRVHFEEQPLTPDELAFAKRRADARYRNASWLWRLDPQRSTDDQTDGGEPRLADSLARSFFS